MSKLTQAYNDFLKNISNEYLDFINECRRKAENYSPEQLKACQIHHIVPRHHYKANKLKFDTFDSPNNRVPVTFEDHIKAHQIRFDVYGEYGDKVAFTKMANLTQEGMRAMQQTGGQIANIKFKEEGRLMHDPKWQSEMGERSMARPDALSIRSKGGKLGNRKRHQNRTVRFEDRYLWFVEGKPFLCTFGFDNGGDLLRTLHQARPTKLQRISPLITGQKKSLHGWSCQKISENSSQTLKGQIEF